MSKGLVLTLVVTYAFMAGVSFVIALDRNWAMDWFFFIAFSLCSVMYIVILWGKLR